MAVRQGRGADKSPYRPKMNFGCGKNSSVNQSKSDVCVDYPEIKPPECSSVHPEKSRKEGLIDELFGENADTEKLMIAALIILLLKEKADMKLILALGYILL